MGLIEWTFVVAVSLFAVLMLTIILFPHGFCKKGKSHDFKRLHKFSKTTENYDIGYYECKNCGKTYADIKEIERRI